MHDPDLIQRYLTGSANKEDVESLSAEIMADENLRKQFVREIVLDAAMREVALEASSASEHSPTVNQDGDADRTSGSGIFARVPVLLATISALAACLVLLVGWQLFSMNTQQRTVAILIESEGASWVSDLPTRVGAALRPGRLELMTGIAKLEFTSGAQLLIEAPATIEIVSSMHARLIDGSAVVEVPETAIGFVVSTRSGVATDLGTRFAVNVDSSSDSTDFEVLDGKVSVDSDSLSEPILLETSGALRLERGVVAQPMEGEGVEPSQVDTTQSRVVRIDTNGHAATFIRGNLFPQGRQPDLLMVRTNWSLNNYDRKAVFTFDATSVPKQSVSSVRLRLNQVESPIGFATRLPKINVFSLYGITTPGADQWSSEATWQDSPSPEEGKLVAEFEIPRSQASGECIIQSDELDRFVQDHMHQALTFVLVRRTRTVAGTEKGLVHAFASPTHPTRKGPTLEIELRE